MIVDALPETHRAKARDALRGTKLVITRDTVRRYRDDDRFAVARSPASVPPSPKERFVVHATFGRGRVLHTNGDKLVIEFETIGEKVLLERFVKDG